VTVGPLFFAPSSAQFLDQLATTPRAVLSLRKLISTATVAVRVRRSSDNAELDIGFSGPLAGSSIDSAALLAHVGSGSGYVVIAYDQTGNAQHAIQATAGKQPRIVNAGAYDGKMVFDGVDDFLKITSLSNTGAAAAIYTKIRVSGGGTDKVVLETSTNYNSNAGALLFYTSSTGYDLAMCQVSGSTRDLRFSPAISVALTQCSFLWDRTKSGSNEIAMWVGGAAQSSSSITSTECTGNFATYDLYIGGRAGTSVFSAPELETLVFYNADTAALRSSI
jgi:hypothetical protein